ncbi:hypothetical protein BIV57_04895 [Mangrovactinospora gilvigrisea]|uniref:GGDEF domain-containing protein n=1 Tax=Mangrovactinospora gilvigrisea TaxID=1428644 RepID=A0A1J7BYQ1_9ACTN|nr:hypothetical protein BIV57_04895 [Mangrovactinospora gilvigrisea]
MSEDRLRAVVRMAQAMAAAPDGLDVARVAADHARVALDASMAAISTWDRAQGRLRILVNDGDLAAGEEPLPADESYPVAHFPEIAEDGPNGPLPRAWIETTEGDGPRAAGLRSRGRCCCVVAPVLLEGRAWGELYAARKAGAPHLNSADAEFAAVLAGQVSAGLAQTERLAAVRRLAFTDPLTGLANRRAVDGRLAEAVRRHVEEGSPAGLIVCDVNGLKRLNDERGHEAGDRMLERFADQLSLVAATLPGALAARLGGDEFCVVVDGAPADEVVRAAEEVCRAALRFPEGEGVACGVASTEDPVGPVESPARLFRLADAAQYRAKAARSARPVVAGRGERAAAVLRLASAEAPVVSEARDRRRFRGVRVHGADAGRLLDAGLAAMDAVDGAGARLAAVAETVGRMSDAAAWEVREGEAVRDAAVQRPAPVEGGAYPVVASGSGGGWTVRVMGDERAVGVRELGTVLRVLVAAAVVPP